MSKEDQTLQVAARSIGKRQVTDAQIAVAKKPAREKETNELSTRNPVVLIKQVADELCKVTWPTGHQMVTYSIIVILFLTVAIALVWGVDTPVGLGIRLVLGK